MRCPVCGEIIPDGTAVCPYCQTVLQEAPPESEQKIQPRRNGNQSKNQTRKNNINNDSYSGQHGQRRNTRPSGTGNGKLVGMILGAVAVGLVCGFLILMAQGVIHPFSKSNVSQNGNGSNIEDDSGYENDQNSSSGNVADTGNTDSDDSSSQKTTQVVTHRYEAYVEDVTWQQAFDRAKQKGGHLAIIQSTDDWQKVVDAVNSVNNTKVSYYLGGLRDSDRVYHWVDKDQYFMDGNLVDESALNGHWYTDQPSYVDNVTTDDGGSITIQEDSIAILMPANSSEWYLNDVNSDILSAYPSSFNFHGKVGYVVEYDEDS